MCKLIYSKQLERDESDNFTKEQPKHHYRHN